MKTDGRCGLLVIGGFGFDNLGDDLILRVALSQIRKVLVDPQITVLSNNPEETRARHRGEIVIFSAESLLRQVILRILSPVFESYSKYEQKIRGDTFRQLLTSIRQSRVVVSLGGGYLNDYSVFMTHFRLAELLFLGLLRKRIVLYAHEVGPLKRRSLRLLARLALRFVTLATVRDISSVQILSELGLSRARITHTTDESWAYSPPSTPETTAISSKERGNICVAVNMMPSEIAANVFRSKRVPQPDFGELDNQILDAVVGSIHDLSNSVRQIEFLSMSSKDERLAVRLHQMLGDRYLFEVSRDLDSQYAALSKCDLLVTMRLHPIIMAAQVNVKPLAIVILTKVNEVMADLGLTESVVQGFPFDRNRFKTLFNWTLNDRKRFGSSISPDMAQAIQGLRTRTALNAAAVRSVVAFVCGRVSVR